MGFFTDHAETQVLIYSHWIWILTSELLTHLPEKLFAHTSHPPSCGRGSFNSTLWSVTDQIGQSTGLYTEWMVYSISSFYIWVSILTEMVTGSLSGHAVRPHKRWHACIEWPDHPPLGNVALQFVYIPPFTKMWQTPILPKPAFQLAPSVVEKQARIEGKWLPDLKMRRGQLPWYFSNWGPSISISVGDFKYSICVDWIRKGSYTFTASLLSST